MDITLFLFLYFYYVFLALSLPLGKSGALHLWSVTSLLPFFLPLAEIWKCFSILMLGLWNFAWSLLYAIIKIQEEPIMRTIWGPCLGHKSAKFLAILRTKGGYRTSLLPQGVTTILLYILVCSLTSLLPVSLPLEESLKDLSISMLGFWNLAWSLPVHNH